MGITLLRYVIALVLAQNLYIRGLSRDLGELESMVAEMRIDSLNEWAWADRFSSPYSALSYANLAKSESQEIGYQRGLGDAYNRLGAIHRSAGNFAAALENYLASLEVRKELANYSGAASVLKNLGNLYNDEGKFELAKSAFREGLEICQDQDLDRKVFGFYNGLGIACELNGELDSAIIYYRAGLESINPEDDGAAYQRASAWNNLGQPFYNQALLWRGEGTHPDQVNDYLDSALHYYIKSAGISEALGDTVVLIDVLNNQGLVFMEKGQERLALDSCLIPAVRLQEKTGSAIQSLSIYFNLSEVYSRIGRVDSAYYFLQIYHQIREDIDRKAENFNSILRGYESREREQERLLFRSETSRKNTFLIAISVIATLILILGLLIWWTSRRRLRIERELNDRREALDAQRILELVQEQELRSLDALLEGQEIERQRIATDLHDRLGGLMATVKLHFNALERDIRPEQKPPFIQADRLIDEACSEIRKISHDLAEGQIAAFGLINAVRDLADSISGAGTLQVKVYDQHLEQRLPLSLERDLYKIIQELLTNVIKHAKATEVTVQLIRHPDVLNLMVEDNGIGMSSISPSGLGLRSIRGRVKAFNGDFHIDTNPQQGTTILIDLPLNLEEQDLR